MVTELRRKQERRVARETRVKEQIKDAIKSEIFKFVIDRGEIRSPAYNYDLVDINAAQDNKLQQTSIGGVFQ
jgi:hypothetical protein